MGRVIKKREIQQRTFNVSSSTTFIGAFRKPYPIPVDAGALLCDQDTKELYLWTGTDWLEVYF